jgi:hypothetical protein
MPLLWQAISFLLAVPMRVQYLPGMYGGKYLGYVLQWYYLAMSGLWRPEWLR